VSNSAMIKLSSFGIIGPGIIHLNVLGLDAANHAQHGSHAAYGPGSIGGLSRTNAKLMCWKVSLSGSR